MALGLEQAGFDHVGLVEIDRDSCTTLSLNRPYWPVFNADVRDFHWTGPGPDLIAAGMPEPDDSFPELLDSLTRLVEVAQPAGILVDNVAKFLRPRFLESRARLLQNLSDLGYGESARILYAAHFGVAQLRPRAFIIAVQKPHGDDFLWPPGTPARTTVGHVLRDLMGARGWAGHDDWALRADGVGPTIIGGSRRHGGADLGPTGSKRTWLTLGVDGTGIADEPPQASTPFGATPRLTLEMVAALQGFDRGWQFYGAKTSVYRQIAGALPPPLGKAIGTSLRDAFRAVA